jgi:hypothetical protein
MVPTTQVTDESTKLYRLKAYARKDCLDLVDVNRTVYRRFAQFFPSTEVPFERFGMGVVNFGSDVAVDGVCQRDGVRSLEGDRQLVRHLGPELVPPVKSQI